MYYAYNESKNCVQHVLINNCCIVVNSRVVARIEFGKISPNISSSPPPNLVAGGCRFGNDPNLSVLNSDCRAHDVENLYVTDASFMPTGGSVPYTWTIYANSFRVADMIINII